MATKAQPPLNVFTCQIWPGTAPKAPPPVQVPRSQGKQSSSLLTTSNVGLGEQRTNRFARPQQQSQPPEGHFLSDPEPEEIDWSE